MNVKNRFSVALFLLAISISLFSQNQPKISRVIEYRPAPGQHINRLFPTPDMSNTYEHALQFANEQLVENGRIVGLGAFGGYIVVGFDHSIVNVKDQYDFKGFGNSFDGSAEPGVVMVCQDLNKNGVPDPEEPWYELAGSEYNNPKTIKNYKITYYRPEKAKQDVKWRDNQGNEGTIKHILYATQKHMYPNWIKEDSITFTGTKLRNTAYDKSGKGKFWVLKAFDYGYIDNNKETDPIEKIGFKIDWAVNDKGEKVHLSYIDFVKVYTGQLQEAGWLGETSTEVYGIEDLHPDAKLTAGVENKTYSSDIHLHISSSLLQIDSKVPIANVAIYTLQGRIVKSIDNQNSIDISDLSKGIYLIKIVDKNSKQITNKLLI